MVERGEEALVNNNEDVNCDIVNIVNRVCKECECINLNCVCVKLSSVDNGGGNELCCEEVDVVHSKELEAEESSTKHSTQEVEGNRIGLADYSASSYKSPVKEVRSKNIVKHLRQGETTQVNVQYEEKGSKCRKADYSASEQLDTSQGETQAHEADHKVRQSNKRYALGETEVNTTSTQELDSTVDTSRNTFVEVGYLSGATEEAAYAASASTDRITDRSGSHSGKTVKDRLNCFMVNARSVVNKIDDLESYVYEENPDVVMITESWANDKICDAELALSGYTTLRNDRNVGRGGGCLFYFRDEIPLALEEDLTCTPNTETVWGKIESRGVCTVKGICYLSPSSSEDQIEALQELIRKASHKYHNTIICGDFNHRSINWDLLQAGSEGQSFLDLVQDCFLIQHVDKPTRGENILDLVLSSRDSMVENLVVREPFGSSDHNIVVFQTITETEINEWKETYYDYRKGDYQEMRKYLNGMNWDDVLGKPNVQDAWVSFKTVIEDAISKFVPQKIRRKSKRKPMWWSRGIETIRKRKYNLWKKYRETREYEDYVEYNRCLNKATKTVKKAKRKLEKKLAKNIKNDPKAFYKYARSKTKTKDTVGPLKDPDGRIINDDNKTATIFNEYFTSVFTQEVLDNLPEPRNIFQGEHEEMLHSVELLPENVLKKLNNIKPEKAPGVDNIYPVVLKELSQVISNPLSQLFTRSLNEREVPDDWKLANVTPIFKKGTKSVPKNYRPVSLTSQVCKLMESLIRDAIITHLRKHNLIVESQHGFTKGRSCLTNLLTFLEEVTKAIDQGIPVDVIYLDFSKAFDKVPHQRLLGKLRAHGLGETVVGWIESWLCGRKQRVVIRGKGSEWSEVTSGVPQGSVLGPTLFLIYINDIDDGVNSSVLKFADDTKIFRNVMTCEQAFSLQEDLTKAHQWSVEWQMLFNTDKCKCMHLGHSNQHYDYFLGDELIESVKEEKDLGVWINDRLSVSAHCAKASKTANNILGTIKRTYEDKSKTNIINLYKTLVRPHLEYAIQAWRPYLLKDIEVLEKVQKRALNMIPELNNMDYLGKLKAAKLTSLETRRQRADLLEVFKIMKGMEGLEPNKFFSFNTLSSTRGHKFKIYKQYTRLNIRKHFFSQRVIDDWNSLPEDAVNSDSLNGFKSQLKRVLKNRDEQLMSLGRLPAR